EQNPRPQEPKTRRKTRIWFFDFLLLPDFYRQLQFHAQPFRHTLPDDLDQLEHFAARGTSIGNDEVGVALADERIAHFGVVELGILDQHGRAPAAGTLENLSHLLVG